MKVYKYRGVEIDIFNRDLDAFKKNKFFAPKFEILNDLFEANFNEIISSTVDILSDAFSIDSKELKEQIQKVVESKHKLGIFSLSKAWDIEQMWAHYASSNRGYCIEYEADKLKDKTKNFDFSEELEVTYSDEIQTLTVEDLKNRLMTQKMYGVKKKKWEYEDEIRLIFDNYSFDKSSLKNHHESAITGVYFGYKAEDSLIDTFKEAFKNRDVNFYRITVNRQKNCLENNLIFESKKLRKFDINKFNVEILKYQNNSVVENYFIYLKDSLTSEELKEFISAFRDKFCYKPCNLNVFDTSKISELIGVYPLKGRDYIQYADACIAAAEFSTEEFISDYPYKDFYYKELLEGFTKT
ncbi:MAG TPA: DUF2971 domain-containing protein [Bacteroidia bacterium]|jgi:hypothetical protein|nr:DUF2971 domain-containing protein [Bacteroidia bacterium]